MQTFFPVIQVLEYPYRTIENNQRRSFENFRFKILVLGFEFAAKPE
jgi:hypothetical protein